MKRAAPSSSSCPKNTRVRLLLHAVDGTIPYMTPSLLRKYVPPSDDLWIGIAVRDSCVVPVYKTENKNNKKKKNNTKPQQQDVSSSSWSNKPCGYTFAPKRVDSFILPYHRVTVPTFSTFQDATDNDVPPASATDKHVLLWTPHGRHKLTPSLYRQVTQGLQSNAALSLYDATMDTEKQTKSALRRNEAWLSEFASATDQQQRHVWAPLVLTENDESNMEQVKRIQEGKCQGIAIVSYQGHEESFGRFKACLEAINERPPQVLAMLSTRSTLEFINAVRAGINMVGTALPTLWAKSKRALVVELGNVNNDSSKRARTKDEDGSDKDQGVANMDADGCMDFKDTQWARDARPILPGCKCMACGRAHSRAYIHHLVQAKELLAEILLFSHNLHHLLELCRALSNDMDAVYDSVKTQLQSLSN